MDNLTLEELYNKILDEFKNVQESHEKFVKKGNKSAEASVRKSLGEIKKLITPYRKKSVEAVSNMNK